MSVAERWVQRPQSVWPRKALFQIHLWTGIGLGIYVLLISLTGSVIIFRNELYQSLWHGSPTVAVSGAKLSPDEMRADIRRAYPSYSLEYMWPAKKPDLGTEVWLTHNGNRKSRYFNPYTGQDLGSSIPWALAFVSEVMDFHTNLLAGDTGRVVNAVGAALTTLIALTGIVIWWPGIQDWRRSFTIRRGVHWKRMLWDLHSAIGIWTLAFVLIWGVTGIYVCVPTQFRHTVDTLIHPRASANAAQNSSAGNTSDLNSFVRDPVTGRRRFRLSPEDKVFRWFYYLHFGNFAGWKVKTIWAVLGLAPAVLFVTGFVMWWNRVVSKAFSRRKTATEAMGGAQTAVTG